MSGAAKQATAQDVVVFRGWLAATLGMRFDDNKDAWLAEIITRRAHANGKLDVASYLQRLGAQGLPDEVAELAADLTVPETSFFRNIEQFQVLGEVVVPQRCKANAASRQLRILSAACATGEEPYSIAMWLSDLALGSQWRVDIDAFDLNPAVLASARRGRYSDWSLRETPVEMRQRWFTPEGRLNLLDQRIRELVNFEVRNLVTDAPSFWTPGRYDVIFCRNVLMYFTPEQTQAVLHRLARSLAPQGFLFVGYAESLRGIQTDFELCQTHGTYYYQRQDPAKVAEAKKQEEAQRHHARHGKRVAHTGHGAPHVKAPSAAPAATRERASMGGSGSGLQSMSAHLAQAHEMFALERFDDAWALMQDSAEHKKNQPLAKRLHVMLLVQQGLLAKAREICHQMAGHGEMPADAHHMLALCEAGAGDLPGALAAERTASSLDPAFAMPHLQSGLLARKRGDTTTGRRELELAMHLLGREEDARVSLFGGGFSRHALLSLCRAELSACGAG